jgi:hypothetical protein
MSCQPLLCTSADTFRLFLPLVKTREFHKTELQPILQPITISRTFPDETSIPDLHKIPNINRTAHTAINDLACNEGCYQVSAPLPPQALLPGPQAAKPNPTPTAAANAIPKPKGTLARPARGGYSLQAVLDLPEGVYKALQVRSNRHKLTEPGSLTKFHRYPLRNPFAILQEITCECPNPTSNKTQMTLKNLLRRCASDPGYTELSLINRQPLSQLSKRHPELRAYVDNWAAKDLLHSHLKNYRHHKRSRNCKEEQLG